MVFVTLLWAVVFSNVVMSFFDFDVRRFGIRPRVVDGLWGIPLHVFLHGGIGHAFGNTIGLTVLGGLVAFRGKAALIGLSVFVTLAGGSLLWLIGRPNTNHIGASGLVFGFFGYLVARGFFQRDILSILTALVAISVYGLSMLFGILPTGGFISWEGHLSGLLAGILYAYLEGGRRDSGE